MDAEMNIVGVGSTLMGDDGVGPAAIEALARRGAPDGAALHDAGLAVSDVLGRLDPQAPLIVIDALRAGGEPGSVYRARLEQLRAPSGPIASALSLHELSVLPALQIEAMTGREFRDVTLFGVEPARVAWGQGLSAAVAAAVHRLVEAVLEYVNERTRHATVGEHLS